MQYNIRFLGDNGAACANSTMRWDARKAQTAARKAAAANREVKRYRPSDADAVSGIIATPTTD